MHRFIFIPLLAVILGCNSKQSIEKTESVKPVLTDEYELYLSNEKPRAILILFGGFPETANEIKEEFEILQHADSANVSVLLMNFNRRLWLDSNNATHLISTVDQLLNSYNLNDVPLFVGGFSSGGNIAAQFANQYALNSKDYKVPKGLFIIDSPIDLAALYKSSIKNINMNFHQDLVNESKWIVKSLEAQLGKPELNIQSYEKASVFTSETNNIKNLEALKHTSIRLYSEPDSAWWYQNRRITFPQTNAFNLEKLKVALKAADFKNVSYIKSEGKGYRADGERHPHSWSIVDVEELLQWIAQNSKNHAE